MVMLMRLLSNTAVVLLSSDRSYCVCVSVGGCVCLGMFVCDTVCVCVCTAESVQMRVCVQVSTRIHTCVRVYKHPCTFNIHRQLHKPQNTTHPNLQPPQTPNTQKHTPIVAGPPPSQRHPTPCQYTAASHPPSYTLQHHGST